MKLRLAILLVTLSGFIALSYELLWFRVFSFTVGGAAYGFALLLWAYLTGIALGSHVARRFCEDEASRRPAQLRRLAGFIAAANLGGYLVIPAMAAMQTAGWHQGLTLVPVMVVAGTLGAQLPLLSHYGIEPDERAGQHMSYLYVGNIIGSVAGSLLTGFVLFDAFTTPTIATGLTVLGLGLAVALYAMTQPAGRGMAVAGLLAVVAAGGVIASGEVLHHDLWARLKHKANYEPARGYKHVVENKSGVITVDQNDRVYGGGIYDGQFSVDLVDDTNMLVRPYALGLFHPNPRHVLMIGLASGSWASVVVNHPDVEKLTIIEINRGYLDLIEKYQPHKKLLDDPRVELVIDDGRRWLNRFPQRRFDAIIANTTFHWRAQASNLLSREWMELVARHLEPGGVYMFNPTGSARPVRTALLSLPYCARVLNNAICSARPFDYDRDRWREELASYEIWGEAVLDLDRPAHRKRLDELMQMSVLVGKGAERKRHQFEHPDSVRAAVESAEPITDDNMGTEWSEFLRSNQ